MKLVKLFPSPGRGNVVLEGYIPELALFPNGVRVLPAILILPGGAYRFVSPGEGEEVALRFCGEGYACFVLKYSVGDDAGFPKPLEDASRSMWMIRQHAEEWHIDPKRVAVMGFSAGAHLGTALATMWHYPELQSEDMPEGGNRPDACVFGYTPTTFEGFEEKAKKDGMPFVPGQHLNVLGEGHFADITSLTTHKLVDKRTPPAFLWKTNLCYPESTFLYAEALKEAGVPYEVHVFTDTKRAGGLCNRGGYAANTQMWVQMALNWLAMVMGEQ